MSEVKRYWCYLDKRQTTQDVKTVPHADVVVLASDYDALAAELERVMDELDKWKASAEWLG